MTTLYRKYRPQTFADIHDQEHIVKTLSNEITSNKIAHAYLFTGPRGVGKTTIARLLAKSLNCQKRKKDSSESCNECSSCTEIAAGNNIDVIEIDAASHTKVEEVRENIIENINLLPTKSPFKIFIIDEVHMLSGSSFNALLKTIEEPPAHVIFILATTELQKLPATVVSRCQRFGFKKITADEMMKKLEMICKEEKIKVSKEVLNKIVIKSEGGLRDAESLLGQILSLNLKEVSDKDVEAILPSADLGAVLNFIGSLISSDTAKALDQINTVFNSGASLEQFALSLTDILRAALIAKTGFDIKNIINADKDTIKEIKDISEKLTNERLIAMIESAIARKREIKQFPIAQLPLELFAVEFGSANFSRPASTTTTISIPSDTVAAKAPIKPTSPAALNTEIPPQQVKPNPITEGIKTVINNLSHKNPPKSTIEEVKAKWPDVINAISKNIPSLTFILKMCSLQSVQDDGLHIVFEFQIHKDKVDEIKNRKLVEDELEKALGERIKIVSEFTQSQTNEETDTSDGELSNIATEFGGELV